MYEGVNISALVETASLEIWELSPYRGYGASANALSVFTCSIRHGR